jgi:hypothetical protein
MMRVKLVGANRASFKGSTGILRFGDECDVDDNLGEHLLAQKAYSKTAGERPLWQFVKSTDGDSAATLEEDVEDVEDTEDEDEDAEVEAEVDAEAEVAKPTPPVKKKAAVKKAVKKTRARRPAA